MLGRGAKRKWSCLDELEVEAVPAVMTEEKEKYGEEHRDDEGMFLLAPSRANTSHLQQRQLVLGLCLEKLQRYQAGMELSLRRSVLLINMLRQIQEDMRCDGARSCSLNEPKDGVHPNSCLLMEDMSFMCPGCAEGNEKSLCPPPPPSPIFSSQDTYSSASQPKSLPAVTINAFSDAVNAMGYLSDLALDDIFEDIDTSMYDTSDLSAALVAGSVWPVSVSLWLDEEVKTCSSSHTSAGSLQTGMMDLNELDHIMEILIRS
ncbi:SERTA domain-containing protein 2-like isoform X2 [Thalassophryne amazonica]|nr:SERTA domain-containing protein 2-like isoform X2 [Thalassophryne amazonica]